MVPEIYSHGDYVIVSTPYQTIADKRAIIERAKTTIKNMWIDRRSLQRELTKQQEALKSVPIKTNMYNSIINNIKALNKKINRREEIIHNQIDMIRRERDWIKRIRRENKALKTFQQQERLKCAAVTAGKTRGK